MLTPGDTARVLAKIAAFDQRTVGAADIAAWHEVLGHLDLVDCLNAVALHYREQSARAMPADIRRLTLAIRDTRQATERQSERRLAIGPSTRDRSPEVATLVQAVADALPKPDLHARALGRARQERGRESPELRQAKQRKPKKKQKQKRDHPPPVSDDVAALATRYLIDGHAPADVADRLLVSRRWCERTARKFRPAEEA